MNKDTIVGAVVVVLIILLGAGAWFVFGPGKAAAPTVAQPVVSAADVKSFEACVAAGYPVMESYPRQCKTPDGRTYAEEPTPAQVAASITYKNASVNDIVVTNPTPGAVTGKSFTVTGKARGWYFEASFPVKVLDASGKTIATGIAQAQSDWMTSEFVAFKAPITVPTSYIGKATLVLMKDNPSGIPENDASASFPFTIEY